MSVGDDWDVDDLSDINLEETIVQLPVNHAFKALNFEYKLIKSDLAILLSSLVTVGLMLFFS